MLADLFLSRSRYWLVQEYPIKLRQCVDVLPAAAIWARSNETSNSVGNLLVHLSGNVSQWILGGVGGQSIERHRAAEFEQRGGATGKQLLDGLLVVLRRADEVLAGLSEKDLERKLVIQSRETTVLGAVYHVVEHFAMHTGQIVLLAKLHAPDSIHFYEDAGGVATPLWHKGFDLSQPAH